MPYPSRRLDRPAAAGRDRRTRGGRNTDEGFHISAGAVIAGTIAAGVAAFVADKLGALK